VSAACKTEPRLNCNPSNVDVARGMTYAPRVPDSTLCYCLGQFFTFNVFLAEVCMSEDRSREPSMDGNALYHEEMITDRKVGMIRRMTPIKSDGSRDLARTVLYLGQAEIMTNMGPMPISFDIEAPSLDQAIAAFGPAATAAIERTVQQIQELRRQQASQLVVPQGGMGGLPGLGGQGGPAPGRGKIQIP
jgi:hypothetical protein